MLFEGLTIEAAAALLAAKGAPQRITDAMKQRQCGDCDFCCTAKGIKDLEPEPKPPWTPCAHLNNPGENDCPGCSIYESKPESCSSYFCAWRLGLGGESGRPDRVGAMVDVNTMENAPGQLAVVIHASGPYKSIPVRRMIRSARTMSVQHVAFVSLAEDLHPTRIEYTNDPDVIAKRLSRHAGIGLTGWNRPAEEGGNDAEE